MNQRIRLLINYSLKWFNFDKYLIWPILLLCIINIVVQFSATDRNIAHLLINIVYLILSLIIMTIIANANHNHIKSIAVSLYIISILLLFSVLIIGVQVNGAKRWLNIGIHIQPSEISKLSVPILMSYYLSLKDNVIKIYQYINASVLIIVPFLLIAKQPDLGTAILVLLAGFYVLFFARLPWKIIIGVCIMVIAISPIALHFLHPYQQHRILTLMNPQSDPLGSGYHIIQAIIAIGSGGFFGKGYLQGTQAHLNFIPEKNTDFVVTVLAEEFGYIGIIILLIIYLAIILRGLHIVKHAYTDFSKFLGGSIVMSFATYVFINMGMVTGIFPVVGVPLPLISAGGTSSIIIMASFGILLGIQKNRY